MTWFRIELKADGSLKSCESCAQPDLVRTAGRIYFVQEASAEQAQAKARADFNDYCAAKKRARIAKLHKAGQCACSRKRDRPKPDGGFYRQCSVCAERREALRSRRREPDWQPRNESERVSTLQARVRDRKNEVRLEVLLEVRRVWEDSRTVHAFAAWLKREIESAVQPRTESNVG